MSENKERNEGASIVATGFVKLFGKTYVLHFFFTNVKKRATKVD